jgi:hypothetical protein
VLLPQLPHDVHVLEPDLRDQLLTPMALLLDVTAVLLLALIGSQQAWSP